MAMGAKSRRRGCCGWLIVLIVLGVVAFGIWMIIHKKNQDSDRAGAAPVPGPPGAINKKYYDALKVAVQFFDVQKCKFPVIISLLIPFASSIIYFAD